MRNKASYYVMRRDDNNVFGYTFVREFASLKKAEKFAKGANGTCVVFDESRYAAHRAEVEEHYKSQSWRWS
jgi:nitrous oxide reductase accessory protein NosL